MSSAAAASDEARVRDALERARQRVMPYLSQAEAEAYLRNLADVDDFMYGVGDVGLRIENMEESAADALNMSAKGRGGSWSSLGSDGFTLMQAHNKLIGEGWPDPREWQLEAV